MEPLQQLARDKLQAATSMLHGVEPRSMFGANGFCKDGKAFCMVTKHSQIVFKVNDEVAFLAYIEMGGIRWSPNGKPFGKWLELPPEQCQDSQIMQQWAQQAYQLT